MARRILKETPRTGGLNTVSRAIAEYLVPAEGDALVSVHFYAIPACIGYAHTRACSICVL